MGMRDGNLDGFLGLSPLAPYLVGSGEQAQARALRGLPDAKAFLALRAQGAGAPAMASSLRGQRAYETLNRAQAPKGDSLGQAPTAVPDTLEAAHRRTLGLAPDQTPTLDALQQAYRRALKGAHPDTGGSAEAFRAVRQAFEALRRA
jgi:hypothetical protein